MSCITGACSFHLTTYLRFKLRVSKVPEHDGEYDSTEKQAKMRLMINDPAVTSQRELLFMKLQPSANDLKDQPTEEESGFGMMLCAIPRCSETIFYLEKGVSFRIGFQFLSAGPKPGAT